MTAQEKAWQRFATEVAGFDAIIRELPVMVAQDPAALRTRLEARWDFATPVPLDQLTNDVIELLRSGLVHVTHPRYFGLFNPSVRPASVMGDALAALYNPQLAAWSHAPVAQELERLVLRRLTTALGYDADTSAAFFTSGGAEANLAATLGAIASRCPEASVDGIAAVRERPLMYVSAESHHSFVKIARMTGLGTRAIREVPVTRGLVMDAAALDAMMAEDVGAGARPMMVVGTAGTTSSGVVDPLHAIADLATRHGAWFHVDAAWGGGAVLSPKLRPVLDGIKRADSVTWDAHKWLSVPMGAGMVFTRHPDAMRAAFAVTTTYMPPDSGPLTSDPFVTTPQWSRRATGLKLFCALAELGMDGYAELIDHQAAMGDLLRGKLVAAGWVLLNETRLPVVNFTHPDIVAGRTSSTAIRDAVYAGGQAWISECRLSGIGSALRACITSYHTTPDDLDVLVQELERARR